MIQLSFSTLTNKELYTLALRTNELCSEIDAVATGTKLYLDNFSEQFSNYRGAMYKIPVTAETVVAADNKRDDIFIGIKTYLRSFIYHPDEQKKKAAANLLNTISQNGDAIYDLSYKIQTAVLEKIFNDVDEKHEKDMIILALTEWFDLLEAAQTDFEARLREYNSQKADEKALSSATTLRPALIDSLRKLFAFIPLQAEITGDKSLKQLTEQLAVEVARF